MRYFIYIKQIFFEDENNIIKSCLEDAGRGVSLGSSENCFTKIFFESNNSLGFTVSSFLFWHFQSKVFSKRIN